MFLIKLLNLISSSWQPGDYFGTMERKFGRVLDTTSSTYRIFTVQFPDGSIRKISDDAMYKLSPVEIAAAKQLFEEGGYEKHEGDCN